MMRLIASRLLMLPVLMLGVTLIIFFVSQVLPGDPARLLAGDLPLTPELRDAIEARYGLNEPLHVQYGRYVSRLLQGDWGESTRFKVPVTSLIADAGPASLILMGGGLVIAVAFSFPLGAAAAKWPNSWIDTSTRVFSLASISFPSFYLAILFSLIFGYYLGWFPIAGRGSPPDLWHLVLPAAVIGISEIGHTSRIFRVSLLDALQEDYTKAARARGLGQGTILVKHAGRNALVPAVTMMGLSFTEMTGTLILVETVFAWPGVGRLLYIGIQWNDFVLISGTMFVLFAYIVVVTLVVDVLHRIIDPRIARAA